MECMGCGSSNALATLQKGFCYICRADDRLRRVEAEDAKLREAARAFLGVSDYTTAEEYIAKRSALAALLGGEG